MTTVTRHNRITGRQAKICQFESVTELAQLEALATTDEGRAFILMAINYGLRFQVTLHMYPNDDRHQFSLEAIKESGVATFTSTSTSTETKES
jgi:hypothetical protein